MAGQLVQFRLTDNEYERLVSLTPQDLSASRQAKRTLLEWMDKQVIKAGNHTQISAANQEVISNGGTQVASPNTEVISAGNHPMISNSVAEVISAGNQQVISNTDSVQEATFCKIGDRVEWRDMHKGKCEGIHRATIIGITENGTATTDTRQTISLKEWLKSWFPVNLLTPPPNNTEIADSRIPAGDTQALIYDGKDRRHGATYAFGTTGVISPRNLTPGSLQWQLEQNQLLLEQCRQERTHLQQGLDAYDAERDRLTREKLAVLTIGQFTADAVGILEAGLKKLTDISIDALQGKNAELAKLEIEKQQLSSLATLAASSNQELRDRLAAATATARALEKQIEVANRENEELRDRVGVDLTDLTLVEAAPGGFSLASLQTMKERFLATKSESTAKTYGTAVKNFLEFLGAGSNAG